MGDTTECNSIESFFGQHQAAPLVGSTKTNVGHLLVAAGMVGITKTILSMSHGVIPPTINVTEPLGSENNVISATKHCQNSNTMAEYKATKQRSFKCFGFGGTNSHLILEQGEVSK